ncbi:hypothetical protein QBC39DRAFT_336284 [Podospora conica]|nr:hypothetical protein QBC39DRAFT_336284 [Schizothecium conicum]
MGWRFHVQAPDLLVLDAPCSMFILSMLSVGICWEGVVYIEVQGVALRGCPLLNRRRAADTIVFFGFGVSGMSVFGSGWILLCPRG